MEQKNLIHPLESTQTIKTPFAFLVFFIIIVLGAMLGFAAVSLTTKQKTTQNNNGRNVNTKNQAGVIDTTTFKDQAEGMLREGGIDGEGNFHLERPGGDSQNVYLTSTTVDLTGYIGKKVRVWGQTFSGEKAGWLMDVGRVETIQ